MLTRRSALVAGLAVSLVGCAKNQPTAPAHVWQGEALGAPGSIKLYGLDKSTADQWFAKAGQTIDRLSRIFSLYQNHSEISRLNRETELQNASPEFLELLDQSMRISELTEGAFDISVQAYWTTVTNWQGQNISLAEKTRKMAKARQLVNYRNIQVSGSNIRFLQKGMAITLNGIAQGYIAEQVAHLLAQSGATSGLVDLGEFQAFGQREFTIDIQSPHNVLHTAGQIKLQNAGLATSASGGGALGENFSHIFAPSGYPVVPEFASVSVVHASASWADALATAFTLMPEREVFDSLEKAGVQGAMLVRNDGQILEI